MSAQNIKWNIKKHKQSIESNDLASEVLKIRGYDSSAALEFIHPSYNDHLSDPLLLPDIEKATKRIYDAITKKEKIVIYGDYDIDGITASALLHDFFSYNKCDVSVYIPDRFEEGYGLNTDALTELKSKGVNLVISVDCGVSAVDQAKYAQKVSLDLIITDHHEPPDKLPKGMLALINPKLKSSKYNFKELAGVGVAFTLVRAMQQTYPDTLELGQEKWLLDLVALGTICDVVPLVGENRVLAYYGLKVMQRSRRVGLRALADVSSTKLEEVEESDLGFRFGPRLNAAGRLKHAKAALNLLLTKDVKEANKLAQTLNELNIERQQQTQEIFVGADKQAKSQKQNMILVLSDANWSSGIIGIVASKIAEKYHKPCIIFSIDGENAKGSARSYGKFSIINAITDCSKYLESFGGHNFAAGLSIKTDNIELFSNDINIYALNNTDISELLPSIDIDMYIDNFSPELSMVDDLVLLKPFGNENQQPLFAGRFHLNEYRLIGQNNTHVKFKIKTPNGQIIDGIAFGSSHKWPFLESGKMYDFAYFLQKNVWQNVARPQLEIVDIKLLKE